MRGSKFITDTKSSVLTEIQLWKTTHCCVKRKKKLAKKMLHSTISLFPHVTVTRKYRVLFICHVKMSHCGLILHSQWPGHLSGWQIELMATRQLLYRSAVIKHACCPSTKLHPSRRCWQHMSQVRKVDVPAVSSFSFQNSNFPGTTVSVPFLPYTVVQYRLVRIVLLAATWARKFQARCLHWEP